ncbi:MAG TPA: response regulator [Telluria sp.]|jgi:signal transduction histidine kinase/DNA-binding response OmpR family regulator/HAMP domain-containing protein
MTLLRSLTLSYRLFLLSAIFALGFIVYGTWSFRTLDRLQVNGPVYQEIIGAKDLIADALPPPLNIMESWLLCLEMAAPATGARRIGALEVRLGLLRDQHAVRLRYWRTRALDADMARLVEATEQPAQRFYRLAFDAMLPALTSGSRADVSAAQAGMAAQYEQHRLAIDALVARAAIVAAQTEKAAATRISDDTVRLRVILLLSLATGLGAAVLIKRSITGPLDEALGLARRVAAGDLSARGHARFADEPGLLLDALDSMSASLTRTMGARDTAEQSLRHAKELTERLIDSANVIIVGLDRAGKVLIYNHTASAVTGYPAGAVLGKVWRDLPLFGPELSGRWPAEEGWDGLYLIDEQIITSATGEQRCIAWQNTVLGDEGGEVALMTFGIDVTDQRAAMAATVKAQEVAEAATRSKSEFLANMSHEIRTPMNAVIGMTRLALNTDLDARQRNYLDKVDRAAHSLLGIINDILDFSKIEAGKLRFEQRPIVLRQVLDHLAAMTGFRAQEKGLELLFDVAPDVPLEMTGDPLRLGQVLLNLVNNAIKFTERGEIIVRVRMETEAGPAQRLRFDVRDSGIGISAEQAGRLFVAFSQADSSTTRTHGGTGLGLSISRKLVEMMDGRLWLDSSVAGATVFSFTARLGQPDGTLAAPVARSELEALKVLVVDDNAAAREIMQGILGSLQMRAYGALSAPAAIVELEQAEAAGDPYQLVLMDWVMPAMNGLDAIRAIRANPAISRTLSIVMVTAYSRDDLLAQSRDLAQLGVLEKPVTPSSVLDAIMSGVHQGRDNLPRPLPQRRLGAAMHVLRGASVLLVEDNEINQELALEILTGAGLSVQVAANGQIALDLLEQHSFDAILMDCQMPVMDGFEATARIRAQPQLAAVPILAMTANAMSGDRERCLAAGMNEHISKPIHQEELVMMLAQWMPRTQGAKEASITQDHFGPLREAGIDVGVGLNRLHGNDIAYRKLLRQFAQLRDGFEGKMRDALASGQTDRAQRLAHHLHGLAANIGAAALAAHAARLEQAIAAGKDDIGAQLTALMPHIDQLQAAAAGV